MSGLIHLTAFDYIILAILFFSTVAGIFRGFVREAISLATWVLAFFAALKFSPAVESVLHTMIASHSARYAVSFIVIFLIVLILGVIINKLVHSFVSATGLGVFDHLLGLIFGAARGVVLITILLFAIKASTDNRVAFLKNSSLAPHFAPLVKAAENYLPAEMKKMSSWMDSVTHGKAAISSQTQLA